MTGVFVEESFSHAESQDQKSGVVLAGTCAGVTATPGSFRAAWEPLSAAGLRVDGG